MNRKINFARLLPAILLLFFLSPSPSRSEDISNQKKTQKESNPSIIFSRFKKDAAKGGFAYQGIRKKHEIEDYLLASIDQTPVVSPWFETEKSLFQDLLSHKTFDVLVVPFQTQLDGVDPVGRSLMTYKLAREIRKRTGLRVAPVPLIHLALGSHARYFDDTAVYRLAQCIGVSHIVWGFAGTHEDDTGHLKDFNFTLVYQSKDNFGSPRGSRIKRWQDIDLSENQLPSLLFNQRLNEVMAFIGLSGDASKTVGHASQGVQPSLPQTPEALFNEKPNSAVAKSYLFQLLGMLTPSQSEFQRQYMFIRSIDALSELDPSHPEYSILTARAYHHLNRRPAALQALEGDNSERAVFLRNIVNGNLPPLEDSYRRLEPSMDKFFALIEYSWLMYRYTGQYPEQHIDEILEKFPAWRYFFNLILHDGNTWDVPTNQILYKTLEQNFPVRRLSTDVNQLDDEAGVQFAFQNHTRQCMRSLSNQNLDASFFSVPNTLDHLLMLEGMGISNLLKRLRFLYFVQCLPKESMKLCRDDLKKYDGHPYFVILYARILYGEIPVLQGEAKKQAIAEAMKNAKLGLWWYGRQGWAFKYAKSVLRPEFFSNKDEANAMIPYQPLLFVIASDYPFLPQCARAGWMRPYIDLIDWSCCDIKDLNSVMVFYRNEKELIDLARKKARGRFLGHPQRYKVEIAERTIAEPQNDPKTLFIQQVKQGSRSWGVYRKLGEMYVESGEYEKAQEIFLKYPGFHEPLKDNRVALSNRAYIGGSYLFWRGAYNETRPLYKFSADLNTGSDACLTSNARLALLDLNLKKAADLMLLRAERYDVSYAYREFMSISHMMGDSKTAWKKFESLLGRYAYPHIWTSAFVGHRIQNTGKQELKKWIKTMAELNQTSRQRSFPARFAFMCLIDRPPDMDMAQFVSEVDDLSKYDFSNKMFFMDPDGELIGPGKYARLYQIDYSDVRIGSKEHFKKMKKINEHFRKSVIPKEPFSFYGSFAVAYTKMKEKAWADAFELLIKHGVLYGYSKDMGRPLTPYVVWAGINCGKLKDVERFLYHELMRANLIEVPGWEKHKPEELCFGNELAVAAYLCGIGDNETALERIKMAFNKRPHTEKRPIYTWYQIVELCEWFYEYSHDARFIDFAIKWAKDYQVIRPMYGWAFAFEAKYTDNEEDRLRALGYALYLDPQSWRIAHFSEGQKSAARKWFNR